MRLLACYASSRQECDDAVPPVERELVPQEVMAELVHDEDRPHERGEEHDRSKDVPD